MGIKANIAALLVLCMTWQAHAFINGTNSSSYCTEEGNFANPNSTNCNTYIKCQNLNGSLVGSIHTCPNETLFDPFFGYCVYNRTCNSSNSTNPDNNGTNSTSTCTKEGNFANPNSTNCNTYIKCQKINGNLVGSIHTCPHETLFDPFFGYCVYNRTCNGSNSTNPDNNGTNSTSTCTKEGNFANPNSTNCNPYIKCQNLNGNLVGSIHTCPHETLFDPFFGYCVYNRTCNGSNSTNPDNNGTNSTSTCTKEGNFANSNSTNCNTYIKCQNLNGSLVGSIHTCPNETLFDPFFGYCVYNRTCNGSNSTNPDNNGTNSTSTCTKEGNFANPNSTNCNTYIKCQKINGNLVGSIHTCPHETLFDPFFGYCVYNRTCNGSNSTNPDNNGTNSTSTCTKEGNFANPNSTNCNTYIKCQNLNGSLVGSIHTCPNETLFDPFFGYCVYNRTCNGSNSTNPDNNGTNSTSTCTKEGNFANPNSTNCNTYIKCQNLNGSLVGSIHTCPNETLFDPFFGYCVYNRTCNGSNSTNPDNNGTNSTSTCTKEGNFANPNSTNCNTYIKCQNLNGSLVGSIHTCPHETLFDPFFGYCVYNRTCNGSNSTNPDNNGTNSTSTCTKEGNFANPNSTNCNTYIKCQNLNGSLVGSIHTCPNETLFDPFFGYCVYNRTCNGSNSTNPDNNGTNSTSTCTKEGNFANPNSTNCNTYIKCQNLNGSLVGSIHTCPNETLFDPFFGYCVYNRTCNGSNSTNPDNNGTNSTSTCTKEGNFANPNSTNCNTYIKCQKIIGNLVGSIHTCPHETLFDPFFGYCVYNRTCNGSNSTNPDNNGTNSTSTCTKEGNFANPNSTNCNTYIKCQKINGNLVGSIHTCPHETLFDPFFGYCVYNRTCNGSNSTNPDNNGTNSTSTCTKEGNFANPNSTNCNTYIKCQNLNGSLVGSIHTCPNETLFDPFFGYCVYNRTCNGSNSTNPDNNGTNSTSTCTKEGNFANPNSTNCNTYIKCQNLNGSLVGSIHTCPHETLFDPFFGYCVYNRTCNGSNSTNPDNNGTNSTSTCTKEGNFANPNSTNCNTYIKCQNLNGSLVGSIHTCPNETLFDPFFGYCVYNRTCNGSNSTNPDNNGTNSTSTCTKEGNFANPNSTNCNTYIKCQNLNGSLVGSIHTCPNETLFDPFFGYCVYNRTCNGSNSTNPDNNGTNSTSTCTKEGNFANPNSTNCNTYIKCQKINGNLVGSIHTCPHETLFDPFFGYCVYNRTCNGSNSTNPDNNGTNSTSTCTKEGNFANSNSTNCNTYIKCINLNGTLVESIHACPNNTMFNPTYGTCVISNNEYCKGSNSKTDHFYFKKVLKAFRAFSAM